MLNLNRRYVELEVQKVYYVRSWEKFLDFSFTSETYQAEKSQWLRQSRTRMIPLFRFFFPFHAFFDVI